MQIRSIPNGSNVFILEVRDTDPRAFRDRLAAAGVVVRPPRDDGAMVIQVNETCAFASAEELSRRFVSALG